MVISEEKVLERARELGFTPIEGTVICAKFAPFVERTAVERGVDMLKESMKFETPDSFYKVLLCAENELVVIPLSWWTGAMKKDEYQAISFADITGFQAPAAKTLSWQGKLTTRDTEYELVISDEKLARVNPTGSVLLKGDWRQNNLPRFIEKISKVAAQ